ncbi:hypothetical protein [Bradyrhizobium sp. DASA03007]|uniref:hypothetical protein n=1 Tax=unclassified Bradyrhizobium TaxID=2631580 RepID=UPI003F701CCE
MKPSNTLSVAEVVDQFRAYREANPAWGVLHLVMEDGNVRDKHVRFCIESALEQGDTEGHELACLLLGLSTTQRQKLRRI